MLTFDNLRFYQRRGYEHLLRGDLPRTAMLQDMGSGKTVTTLSALDVLQLTGQVGRALVIAPKRVAKLVWPLESEKWAHLRHLDITPVVGDQKERALAIRRDSPVHTINYENIPWLMDQLGSRPWPWDMVIADESTKLKGFRLRKGGKRTAVLAKIAGKVRRWVNLTGTPRPNGLIDLWGQFWFLDAGRRLGRTFSAYKDRWFYYPPTQAEFARLKPFDHSKTQIEAAIADLVFAMHAADYLELPPIYHNRVYVELNGRTLDLYRRFEKDAFMELGGLEIEAMNAGAKYNKLLQLASGFIYTNGPGQPPKWEVFDDAKLDALADIIGDAQGAPILVAYTFKADLHRLKQAFPQGREFTDDAALMRAWNAGKVPLLFAHPASMGHGLSLQEGGNILVFFSHDANLEYYEQIIERIGPMRQAQSGLNRPVFVHHLIAADTHDEPAMARLLNKGEEQKAFSDAMKEFTSKRLQLNS